MRKICRTHLLIAVILLQLAALIGCQNSSPSILGYQLGADSLYDPNIKTVYVPIFKNRAFQTTPYRGLEERVTRAVVREIGSKTRFKVVSDPDRADTELLGNIVSINKTLVNRNQQNATREAEVVVTIDVLWRDLRDGRILSAPRPRKNAATGGIAPVPFDPNVQLPPPTADAQLPVPTRIVAVGRLIDELGETNASAEQRVVDQIATQIISMMEKQW